MIESVIHLEITQNEIINCISDTAELIKDKQADNIAVSFGAVHSAKELTDNVEFWKWIGENYHCLDSAADIQQVAERAPQWLKTSVIQGKGYEWDWMVHQRSCLENVFSRFDAGTDPCQIGIDITQSDLLTNKVTRLFQNKAYTSGNSPKLTTTSKDVVVVTNAENVAKVQSEGYEVAPFQNNKQIAKARDSRFDQAVNGRAAGTYTLGGVGLTMVKSGAFGALIGITSETIASYKRWKNGQLSTEGYLTEIAKSGGQSGLLGAATSGIMIPITAAITAAGCSSLIGIPIAIVLSTAIDKIIAPAFGRGDYAKILKEARYYQNCTHLYDSLALELDRSADEIDAFVYRIAEQDQFFDNMKEVNIQLNEQHRKYDEMLSDNTLLEEVLDKI